MPKGRDLGVHVELLSSQQRQLVFRFVYLSGSRGRLQAKSRIRSKIICSQSLALGQNILARGERHRRSGVLHSAIGMRRAFALTNCNDLEFAQWRWLLSEKPSPTKTWPGDERCNTWANRLLHK